MIDSKRQLTQALVAILEPIDAIRRSDDERAIFGALTGLDVRVLADSSYLSDFEVHYERLVTQSESAPGTQVVLLEALEDASLCFEFARSIPSILEETGVVLPAPRNELETGIIAYLLLHFLKNCHRGLYRFLILSGIVTSDLSVHVILLRETIDLHKLAALLKLPVDALRNLYFDGKAFTTVEDANQIADILFPALGQLSVLFGCHYLYDFCAYYSNNPELEALQDPVGDRLAKGMLAIILPIVSGDENLTILEDMGLGVMLQLAPSEVDGLGLMVAPLISSSVSFSLPNWSVAVSSAYFPPAFAVGVNGLRLPATEEPQPLVGNIVITKNISESSAFLIGDTTGTRVEIGSFTITGSFSFDLAPENRGLDDFGIEAVALAGKVVVAPADGDTFLKAILPAEGLEVPFDFGIGWSKQRGLYFKGAASLDATLPVNLNVLGLSVLFISNIHLAIRANQEGIGLETSASAKLTIGPFSAGVERLGMSASFDFMEEYDGNLGPINLDLGFKPPKGIDLTLKAGELQGGGFLALAPELGDYSGAFHLKFGGLTLDAIGVLNTKLETDPDAFSLVVLISATFDAIPLGFGIKLEGVGGLLGVNRRVDTEELQAGLRARTLDSILFPTDVVKNAATIISDLQAVCPPTEGQYVLGPMVKLSWGSPTLVTATLGIFLEFPEPFRLLLLGQLKAALPEPTNPLVLLQLDVVGVLDFDQQTVAIDAVLRDSKVLDFTLSGDFALRAGWGGSSNFVLSAGGFHPATQIPPGFPNLERLAIVLSNTQELKLRCEAYLALTPNTAQIGAKVDLSFTRDGATLSGHLGFDALFQFSPFRFSTTVSGAFAASYDDTDLCGVTVILDLTGPNQWRAKGKAEFEVLGFIVAVDFDQTFGTPQEEVAPQAYDINEVAMSALTNRGNWLKLPPSEATLVTLRDQDATDLLLIHPLGTLGVRQSLVPLNIALELYNGVAPIGSGVATLQSIQIESTVITPVESAWDTLKTEFAPAQFFKMSDTEKLNSPAFEQLEAGVSFVAGGLTLGGVHTVAGAGEDGSDQDVPDIQVAQTYKSFVIDSFNGVRRGTLEDDEAFRPLLSRVRTLAKAGAAGKAPRRQAGRAQFAGPKQTIKVGPTLYVVANRMTREAVAITAGSYSTAGSSYIEARRAMESYYAQTGERATVEVMPLHEAA